MRVAESLSQSNPLGVNTVITLCPEIVRRKAEDINYLRFPIVDGQPVSARQIDTILDAIWTNIRWGKVLVHCVAGASRSPVILAGWMHAVGYKEIEECLAEIQRLNPIDPNPVLLQSVQEALR